MAIKYFDMEYVDGKNLTDIKLDAPGKKLAESQAKAFGKQIAKGLAYAHEEKVIHRDIKPQNILVSQKSGVKIMDFGISETVRSSMSRMANSSSSGTLVYMSPEQLKGKDVGKEADIYSFGCLLYELVAGKTPFSKGDIAYQIINEKPERILGISDGFNDVLQKCLAKDYKNRYRSFGEVQTALELKRPEPVKPKVAESPRPQPVQVTTPPPVPKKPAASTKPLMMGLLIPLVLIVGVLAVGYLAIRSSRSKPQETVASTQTVSGAKKGTLTVRTTPTYAGVTFINYLEDYKDDMPLDSGRY